MRGFSYGRYIGADARLKGEHALLRIDPAGDLLAQFDDTTLEHSHGWHPYADVDFEIIETDTKEI